MKTLILSCQKLTDLPRRLSHPVTGSLRLTCILKDNDTLISSSPTTRMRQKGEHQLLNLESWESSIQAMIFGSYEAPGFRDCTEDPLFMCTSDKDTGPTDVTMGKTTTGSHG